MNLMTKKGQTTNYKASDHIKDLERYLGRKVDYILVNNAAISQEILSFYRRFGEKQVEDDLLNDQRVIRLDLISQMPYNKSKADMLFRSLLRHDPEKVAKIIWGIINE